MTIIELDYVEEDSSVKEEPFKTLDGVPGAICNLKLTSATF